MSGENQQRHVTLVGLSLAIAVSNSLHSAFARPFQTGVAWPKGATLEVYVEEIDPPNMRNSRQSRIAEGIRRWQNELGRGYTINVHLGRPPDPAPENLIHFRWVPPGFETGKRRVPFGGAITRMIPDDPKKPTRIVKAEGFISNRAIVGQQMANLGMHEFSHALGLADDPWGTVTSTNVDPINAMRFSARDRAEIATLYGRKPAPPNPNPNQAGVQGAMLPDLPRGRVDLQSVVAGQYDYRITFEGDETEIVDVVTFFVNPSLVTNVVPPTGWLYLDPVELAALGADHPYFTDYMEDGFTDPAPWESLNYVALRSSEPQYDLSLMNPALNFSIHTHNAAIGLIKVFAGNEHQEVLGPVPEPSALLLLSVGLACVGIRFARPSRHARRLIQLPPKRAAINE